MSTTRGINRRGLERPIPIALSNALRGADPMVLDGELIGDMYYAFDLLELNGKDLRPESTEERHKWLTKVISSLNDPRIRLVPLVTGEKDKRALYQQLKKGRKEGIVFKKIHASYEAGRYDDLKKAVCVKIKFWNDADLFVERWNQDKMSVMVKATFQKTGLVEGEAYVDVGNVTIPEKYAKQVKPMSILRVKYLFATDKNILYQPRVDPTDDGQVVREPDWDGKVTKVTDLKHEGKEEE